KGVVWHFGPVPATGDAGATDGAGANAWAKVASGAQANLLGGFRVGAGDLWFVGAWGEILHWKNQSWTEIASSTSANRLAIGGVSSTDAWIVGDETLHRGAGGRTRVDRGT